MAGLFNHIAKQILGTQKPTAQRKTSVNNAPISVKPAERPKADEWVKNSTISNPVSFEEKSLDEEIPEIQAVEIVDRTVRRERTKTDVEKEDYLLSQIDEFREKAQQLQELLLSKESKAIELQNIVDEREVKAQELEHILAERQRKADGITAEVAKQIDNLIEKVAAKMDEIGTSIGTDLENGQKLTVEQLAELRETLAAITEQLDTIKGELSEKVHSENVKCYRNIADLFKSMDEKMESMKSSNQTTVEKSGAIYKCTIAIIVLTVLNMLGLAVSVLLQLGVFQ